MRGEVLLLCCYVQGSLYTMRNFRTLTDTFYYENEDGKSAEKSNIQMYYIQPITPVLQSCDPCDMSEMPFQHNSDIVPMTCACDLTCQHASNFWGHCTVLSHGSNRLRLHMRHWGNIGQKWNLSERFGNHKKWSEIVRNDWKRVGLGQVTSVTCGAITWSSTSAVKIRR